MIDEKKVRPLLIDDIVERCCETWEEPVVPDEVARRVAEHHLDKWIKQVKGPAALGLYWGLEHPKLKRGSNHPVLAVPRASGSMGRQQLAYLLHQQLLREYPMK